MEQVKEKVQIKESEVIAMIHEGKSREEVGAHYGLDNADTVALFKHEAFKGLRAKKQRGFVVVKDEETFKDEIKDFFVEETANLPVTGEIDEETATEVAPPAEEVKEVQAPAQWD